MATKPECPYCGRTTGLRQVHEGCGSIPAEYTCEGCFTASDTGPCFDDLPLAPITMTPREAGEAAFYECEGNNAACLKAAFDAYEAAQLAQAAPVTGLCTMGIGCVETGICYAAANGQPERCAAPSSPKEA